MIAVVNQQELPDGGLILRDYWTLGQVPICGDHSHQAKTADQL